MISPETDSRLITDTLSDRTVDIIASNRRVIRSLLARGLRKSQLLTLESLIEKPGSIVPLSILESFFSHTKHPIHQLRKTIGELRALGFEIHWSETGYSLASSKSETSEAR